MEVLSTAFAGVGVTGGHSSASHSVGSFLASIGGAAGSESAARDLRLVVRLERADMGGVRGEDEARSN